MIYLVFLINIKKSLNKFVVVIFIVTFDLTKTKQK